ncbi:MAG: hypothetical protein LC687_02380, partial [Actinobacteria bacterium]|nr:hypothetical protein [Actinomycetota bacterium]
DTTQSDALQREKIEQAAPYSPGVGDAIGAKETADAIRQGNLGGAAFGAVTMVPVLGDVAKLLKKMPFKEVKEDLINALTKVPKHRRMDELEGLQYADQKRVRKLRDEIEDFDFDDPAINARKPPDVQLADDMVNKIEAADEETALQMLRELEVDLGKPDLAADIAERYEIPYQPSAAPTARPQAQLSPEDEMAQSLMQQMDR